MARSHLLRNTISISILSIIILVATSWTFRGPLIWRKMIHYPSHLVRPYQAPMLGCENLDVIEGSYCVFLHHGSKIERHVQTIGHHVDWSPTIRHLFPETPVHGLYYCAHDVNDAALKAIRADIAVDFVECDWPLVTIPDRIEVELWDASLSAWVPEQPSSSQTSFHSTTPPAVQTHRAPLLLCDSPQGVTGSFGVHLRRGASLEEHRASLAGRVDLESIMRDVHLATIDYATFYYIDELDDGLLEAIRSDTRVQSVECIVFSDPLERPSWVGKIVDMEAEDDVRAR